MPNPIMVKKNCLACGDLIDVRLADHKRGWGKFCDKACSAAYKCRQRPVDVNEKHAKTSMWAAVCWGLRVKMYGGEAPPKAPSIGKQLGHGVRVVHKRHSPAPDAETTEERIEEEIMNEAFASHGQDW